jgi:muramoyltetrapeptide carboxypeptidase
MVRIGVVAPGRRLGEAAQAKLEALVAASGLPIELFIHPQCQLEEGHFAGPDQARLDAFVECANEPSLDAIWFARGGYGAARLLTGLEGRLKAPARNKVYLGYSDAGFLLSALFNAGCRFCAHGPLVGDIDRVGGNQTALRALRFLARQGKSELATGVEAYQPNLAFNLTILRSLLATQWEPQIDQPACLWLEDVGEYTYATDRSMFQLTNSHWFKAYVANVRIGRFSLVPTNDVSFAISSEQSVAHWCAASGVDLLGACDIGHDVDNKIVPFGYLRDWQQAGLI